MANSDKDILITPNKGLTALPEISFVGSGNVPIKLRVLDDNTISFEGTSGQLFSVNNNLTSGTIFSVNDVSGIPSISVDASGRVDLARYNGSVNIGPNSTTTDKQLAITGRVYITSPVGSIIPAEIHFGEGGTVTGTGSMYIGYDGPNYSDNNNYWYVRNSLNTDILSVTYGGGVGINGNNPRTKFQIFGAHSDTSWRLTLPAGNNGLGNGEVNMQAWVSEPGLTWDGGGIGMNVANYYTNVYPTGVPDSSNSYLPRLNSNIGQAFIRFIPNTGQILFSTTRNDNTQYRDQVRIQDGCLHLNVAQNSAYRVNVGGDVNVTGDYRKNGVIFSPLPTQTDSTRGSYLVSDGANGAFWAYPGTTITSAPLTGFRYRSLFTHGFLAGGYKGSNPWRSVNKTWHATDVTFYCGEQLDRAASYLGGTWSDYNGYVHGTVDSFSGSSTHTSSYNLHTGVIRARGDGTFSPGPTFGWDDANPGAGGIGYTTWGGWDMSVSRDYHGCAVNQVGQNGYVQGGGSASTDKLHFPTEVMYTTTAVPAASTFVSGAEHEDRAWWSGNGWQGYMLFSNDSYTSQGWLPGADGWNKHLSTKWGHIYGSKGGNTYTGISKINASTGATISDFSKLGNWGEENMEMGQDKGYMLGNYNGNQNNETASINYATDVWTALGAAARPKGHYGQSSGACSSASATVTAMRAL